MGVVLFLLGWKGMEILKGERDDAILASKEHLLKSVDFIECRCVLDTSTMLFP